MTRRTYRWSYFLALGFIALSVQLLATPANKAALKHHYDRFMDANLARCTTCHLPSENKDPQSLAEFPHNPFGARLRKIRADMGADGKSLGARLERIAAEDSDGDGVENEKELLLGYNP